MKRFVVISIISFLLFSVTLWVSILFLRSTVMYVFQEVDGEMVLVSKSVVKSQLINGLFFLFCSILTIVQYALIASSSLKIFQPIIEKYNLRKKERAAARAEKAESEKQKEVAELEKRLEELKNE